MDSTGPHGQSVALARKGRSALASAVTVIGRTPAQVMPADLTRHGAMIEALPQMASLRNNLGHHLSNAAWREFFGARSADWTKALHPDDRPVLERAGLLVGAAGRPVVGPRGAATGAATSGVECRLRNPGGEYEWFLLHLLPLPESGRAGGRLHLISASQIDRDHPRDLERDHVAAMRKTMLDVSPDCLKLVSPEGNLKAMNRTGCLALGVDGAAGFGMDWLGLLPPEIRDLGAHALERARLGEPARFAGRSECPGQPPQYWENILTPVLDAAGQVVEIACVSRDVTSEILQEKQIRQISAGLELATEAAHLGSFEIRPQEGQFCWDKRCAALFGQDETARHSGQASYAGSLLASAHPDDRDRLDQAIQSAMFPNGERRFACEFRAIAPDGFTVIHMRANGVTLFDETRPWRLIGTVQDVSAERSLRRKLAEAHAEIETALDFEQRAAAEMQHRVKHLFAVVSGLIDLAEREQSQSDAPEAALPNLKARLGAMAQASEYLAEAPLGRAVAQVMDPLLLSQTLLSPHEGRIVCRGAVGGIDRRLLSPLVLTLHELATHAVNHGALSLPSGQISLDWHDHGEEVEMIWRESCGPEGTAPPGRAGFGAQMLEEVVTHAGGRLMRDWQPSGLEVRVRLPRH